MATVDRFLLLPERTIAAATIAREGSADGVCGWFDDDVAFVSDWGFELGRIVRPVTVWQGEQDRFVPFTHGRWLAEHISGALTAAQSRH